MLIAFEGPDNTGKSTSANATSSSGQAIYQATKQNHKLAAQDMAEPGAESLVQSFDRIDWFSHMVYRLALPEHEWNDERPRTVFAMPDTHLVVSTHAPESASRIDDELYTTGTMLRVSPLYAAFGEWLMALNEVRNYTLFQSVTLMEVELNQATGAYHRRLLKHNSEGLTFGTNSAHWSDAMLLDLLRNAEQQAD